MCYETEYSIMPEELDTISSSKFVYIRKDIEAMEKEGDVVYKCKEQRLTKDDFDLYKRLTGHDVELSEVRDAVIELSEIVAGV